ncbi:hypothetical protein CEXT_468871, partial [Caerostris extrusa]
MNRDESSSVYAGDGHDNSVRHVKEGRE